MRVRRLLAAGVLLAAPIAAAVALGGGGRTGAAPGRDLPELEKVSFVSVCGFTHRAPDDPIVFPRSPGASHDHTFFGSFSTDAFSTPASLRAATTSCRLAGDTAAYWAPTLLVEGKPVEPTEAEAYYGRRTLARVRPFPAGLAMVAGDAYASTPQSTRIVAWDCGELGRVAPSSRVPSCPAARGDKSLRLRVRFPDCWDGRRLDTADHRSHMAYSSRGACPSSHRVEVPSLTLRVRYQIAGGTGVELASRGQLSGHADFVNAWQQRALERLVDYCLNALRACGLKA